MFFIFEICKKFAWNCTHTHTPLNSLWRRRVVASREMWRDGWGRDACSGAMRRAKNFGSGSQPFFCSCSCARAGLTRGVWKGFSEEPVLEMSRSPPKRPLKFKWLCQVLKPSYVQAQAYIHTEWGGEYTCITSMHVFREKVNYVKFIRVYMVYMTPNIQTWKFVSWYTSPYHY